MIFGVVITTISILLASILRDGLGPGAVQTSGINVLQSFAIKESDL